ncbi:hypothetical protein GW17_00031953 [Ensete ventricosum]|nr:hypothetical protein GW17_00031953 [Ensete ventricosum]RZR84567.1 hypothetical protein BHM03_00011420 [Ensete ventricosum]
MQFSSSSKNSAMASPTGSAWCYNKSKPGPRPRSSLARARGGGTADESNGVGFFTGSSVLPPLPRQHHPEPGYSLLEISAEELKKVTGKVYFDIEIAGKPVGTYVRVVLTALAKRRFIEMLLLIGEKGRDKYGVRLYYKGSTFHRIIPHFMIQGGDIVFGNGRGIDNIYDEPFADENFKLNHTGPGILSMANAGPDTNGCQFFITTVKLTRLDGKHVVFGEVLSGMDVVYKIEAVGQASGVPRSKVVIAESGELRL